jgi:hypothetical protein
MLIVSDSSEEKIEEEIEKGYFVSDKTATKQDVMSLMRDRSNTIGASPSLSLLTYGVRPGREISPIRFRERVGSLNSGVVREVQEEHAE